MHCILPNNAGRRCGRRPPPERQIGAARSAYDDASSHYVDPEGYPFQKVIRQPELRGVTSFRMTIIIKSHRSFFPSPRVVHRSLCKKRKAIREKCQTKTLWSKKSKGQKTAKVQLCPSDQFSLCTFTKEKKRKKSGERNHDPQCNPLPSNAWASFSIRKNSPTQ